METTYFSVDARRVRVSAGEGTRRAAGDGGSVCYAVIPRRRPAPERPAGRILTFPAGRTAPEPEDPLPAEEGRPGAEPAVPSAARAGRPGLSLVLDLLATGAVLGAAGAASLRFLLG